ncbi:MAG: hypothetical protein L0Y77_10600 [Chlorobi bacterium]|nr:hypothetical protein [Chlorobiota bacterium]
MKTARFTKKKLINLGKDEITALRKLRRVKKLNESEIIREGIKLMQFTAFNKKPEGAQFMSE